MIRDYLVTCIPIAGPYETSGEVLTKLRGQKLPDVSTVCLVDEMRKFVGSVSLSTVVAADAQTPLSQLMLTPPTIRPDCDQEVAASLAIRQGLSEIPVVDTDGQLLGLVPQQAILSVLREEHLEDLHHLAGIWQHSNEAKEALQAPPLKRARYRLPWLIIGLLGSMIAAKLVASFEDVLRANLAVAFFIPMIVYLADAVGTQSEAVAVRGLSLTEVGIRRLLLGEIGSGLIMGSVLSAASGLFALLVFNDTHLALTVGISLLAACAVATGIGLYLPWVFSRFGHDPALASGPIATVIQDVLSLAIYFGWASLFL